MYSRKIEELKGNLKFTFKIHGDDSRPNWNTVVNFGEVRADVTFSHDGKVDLPQEWTSINFDLSFARSAFTSDFFSLSGYWRAPGREAMPTPVSFTYSPPLPPMGPPPTSSSYPSMPGCIVPMVNINPPPAPQSINYGYEAAFGVAPKPSGSGKNPRSVRGSFLIPRSGEFSLDFTIQWYKNQEEGGRKSWRARANEDRESLMMEAMLASDFKSLLRNRTHADVKIVCKNGEIMAHKAVLSARSLYFKELLSSPEDIREIKEEDFSLAAMEAVLDYLYSGCTMSDLDFEIIAIVQKFRLEFLLDWLAGKITEILTPAVAVKFVRENNAGEVVVKAAISYIKDHMQEVQKLAEWDQLCQEQPQVLRDLVEVASTYRRR